MSEPAIQRVAILGTLDTKGDEISFLAAQIRSLGCQPVVFDVGVLGEPTFAADIARAEIAEAGGTKLVTLLQNPTRQEAANVMIGGATALLQQQIDDGSLKAVVAVGGTQGTSLCSQVMQALPYGFPKIMVSTVASGDTSSFVGIKDITMMFSVCDILGLNPLTRKILGSAAGAACGMVQAQEQISASSIKRPTIGMTNLGVLTDGTMLAKKLFEDAGFEVMVFHAVGAGGLAMEQMMKDGLLVGVFDYGLGEIADELFGGLRAANRQRLTVAGQLGLPQVICPGGAEHIGIFVEVPNELPERFQDQLHVFHSPLIVAPRLKPDEFRQVAQEVCRRLQTARGPTCVMFPSGGTSRYSVEGGPLCDPVGDAAFLEVLRGELPPHVELIECAEHAEHPKFVGRAVDKLLSMIESTDASLPCATR